MERTRYHLDEANRIISIGAGWSDFAQQNGAHDLTIENLRGRSLWEFVAGLDTRHLYEVLFSTAREKQAILVIPFRCDSPGLRRFMELEISPSQEGLLQLEARLLRIENRPFAPILDPNEPRSYSSLKICSFCKRVELDPTVWLEIEAAVKAMDLLGDPLLPRLSHAACPHCELRVREAAGGPTRAAPSC